MQRGRMVYEATEYAVKGTAATKGTVLARTMVGSGEPDGWLVDWSNGVRSIHAEQRLVIA